MKNIRSIIDLEVVGIDQRGTVGKVVDVMVDCDEAEVSHLVIDSAQGSSQLLLPFRSAIGIGDDYVVIQSSVRDAADSLADPQAATAISEGFDMLDTRIVAASGNIIGPVADFEVDERSGAITKFITAEEEDIDIDRLLFISPDFVFVNGEGVVAQKPDMAPDRYSLDDETEKFLMGNTLAQDVTSDNGVLHLEAGTLITRDIIESAQRNDALMQLAMAVDTER